MKLDDEKLEMIVAWSDDLIGIVKDMSNDLIDLSENRLQIQFLIARFSVQIVYGVLDRITSTTKNGVLQELMTGCQERLREIYAAR